MYSISYQLQGVGVSVIEGIDPNPDNYVSAGIVNTKSVLIGCLLRLEPNKDKKVRHYVYIILVVAFVKHL